MTNSAIGGLPPPRGESTSASSMPWRDEPAPAAQTKLVINRLGEYEGAELEIVCAPSLSIGLRQIRETPYAPAAILLYFYGISRTELRAFAQELIDRIDRRGQ